LKKVHKKYQATIPKPARESSRIEDSLDVEATLDTLVHKVRPLSDVYERYSLI